MDVGKCYEELRQHIHALLDKYESFEIHSMVDQVVNSRPVSTVPNSNSSQVSRISTDSRVSTLSTDYAPSLISSTSSHSRLRYDPSFYPFSLIPARYGPVPPSASASEVLSPADTYSQASPLPTDCDSRSTASSTARRERSAKKGCWFCTFCTQNKTFSAKSDWKKHEERYHETGEDWPCAYPGCERVFVREQDFVKHCQQHHPRVPPLTDVKLQLLPPLVYGCGFDGCKAVLNGWKERCNHVADEHMKKEGRKRPDWKYSTEIHNLLRQDATRYAWKKLLSALETKQARYHITWTPDNTRILKQKLQCSDMRPNIDIILHTALQLRHSRPYNEVTELDPRFKIPSQDSIPNFRILSQNQRNHILRGIPTDQDPSRRMNCSMAPAYTVADDDITTSKEPHPGTLVEYDMISHSGGSLAYASEKRNSYSMDVDQESFRLPSEPDPVIPYGIDQDPSHFDFNSSSRSPEALYSCTPDHNVPMPSDWSPHQRHSSKGHIFQKSIKHFTTRLSPK